MDYSALRAAKQAVDHNWHRHEPTERDAGQSVHSIKGVGSILMCMWDDQIADAIVCQCRSSCMNHIWTGSTIERVDAASQVLLRKVCVAALFEGALRVRSFALFFDGRQASMIWDDAADALSAFCTDLLTVFDVSSWKRICNWARVECKIRMRPESSLITETDSQEEALQIDIAKSL